MVADARKSINDREVAWELSQAQATVGEAGPNETRSRRIESLESQLQTAARMDALIASTKEQLDLLNARLDEAVTRAIELSVSKPSTTTKTPTKKPTPNAMPISANERARRSGAV